MGASSTGARAEGASGLSMLLTQRISDADQQHPEDEAVQRRIGHEGPRNGSIEDHCDETHQDQEHRHPKQEDAG
jgi:hypothetical protein